jgi:hypothetical protein
MPSEMTMMGIEVARLHRAQRVGCSMCTLQQRLDSSVALHIVPWHLLGTQRLHNGRHSKAHEVHTGDTMRSSLNVPVLSQVASCPPPFDFQSSQQTLSRLYTAKDLIQHCQGPPATLSRPSSSPQAQLYAPPKPPVSFKASAQCACPRIPPLLAGARVGSALQPMMEADP